MPRPEITAAPQPGSQSARLIDYLKQVFRAHGLRYVDIAGLVGVSEKTVKRYMGGRGVTLAVLERLCAAGGITLRELSELASDEEEGLAWTTEAQENALAADLRMAIVFSLISNGWSAARIVREGLADESGLTAALARLDRLGVITLYPGNRIRIRARIRPTDACAESLRRAITRAGAEVLQATDFGDLNAPWRLNFARLGPASLTRAVSRMGAFFDDIAELSRQDMDLSGDQVKWYALCAVLHEHDPLGLQLLRADQAERTSRLSESER